MSKTDGGMGRDHETRQARGSADAGGAGAARKRARKQSAEPEARSDAAAKPAPARRKKPAAKAPGPNGHLASAEAPAPADPASDPAARLALIARAAYFRAEKRGFGSGGEMQDWLEAEAEVEALLRPAKG